MILQNSQPPINKGKGGGSQYVAEIFNEFSVNIVPNFGLNTNHSFLTNTGNENDPIEKAITKYKTIPI